jgi:hypothetical protein
MGIFCSAKNEQGGSMYTDIKAGLSHIFNEKKLKIMLVSKNLNYILK